jgi:hypothetical protein
MKTFKTNTSSLFRLASNFDGYTKDFLKTFYMKKLISIFLLLPVVMSAQVQVPKAPGMIAEFRTDDHFKVEDRDVIWSENFTNGIPASWENSELGGVAHWEYRGPFSLPNSEVGTRGSCLPEGVLGDPILGPSAPTGFVIFDSNWWDNPDNPCTPDQFGTGPAPGPHFATLTTPSIDLSSYTGVALVFRQYMKLYEGETRVELSISGGVWQTVFVNPALPNPTSPDAEEFVQLSLFAGGQSDVRIRFVFDGLYYFWMLDDIQIIESYGSDLAISDIDYGDFDLYDLSHPTGFEFMEYSKYPEEMSPMLKFSATAENRGIFNQTDCKLHAKILDFDDNVIHDVLSEEGTTIPVGSSAPLRAGTFQMPSVWDNYRIAFDVVSQFSEENPIDNFDTAYFNINDVQYARDHYFTSAIYVATPDLESDPYEIGNVFHISSDGLSVHSISVGVGVGSSVSESIIGRIYSFDISEALDATLIGTTESVVITQEMINGAGEQVMTNLVFSTPISVEEGNAYFVTVGSENGTSVFVCGLSGDAYEYSAFVRFNGVDWYTIDRIPMVRMNFGFYDHVSEVTSSLALKVFPNPTSNKVFIELNDLRRESLDIRLYDAVGKVVFKDQLINYSLPSYEIDMSKLEVGSYLLEVISSDALKQQTIIRN